MRLNLHSPSKTRIPAWTIKEDRFLITRRCDGVPEANLPSHRSAGPSGRERVTTDEEGVGGPALEA